MIKTRLAGAAAASLFGLAALAGTVATVAAPANAAPGASSTDTSSAQSSTHTSNRGPAIPIARPKPADPKVGQPFSKNPYPQVNPFPGLAGNPWAQ
jgi:hypothetical protein